MSDIVYVALGSNLGDREATLERARKEIANIEATRIVAESDIEETAPIGPVKQDFFLNQMIAVETDLEPRDLLDELQKIENGAGRDRSIRWGPRTLDLDIVMIEGREYSDDVLVVPHPELPKRHFWLREIEQIKGALHV